MIVCPSCGAENAEGARFCAACGSSLIHACESCHVELPHDARFCPACGAAVLAPPEPGHAEERRIVTLLFADLVDSTVLGEQLDPEDLRQLLDAYFAAMREEIEAEGGTLEKFIGDAIVAAFGTPVAHEDDAARALRAALRMQARLPSFNDTAAPPGVRLRLRVGVNTGEVLATLDPKPGEPVFTGDAVNTAARVQSLAEPGLIVASERTVRAARGFQVRDLGERVVKGKIEPVHAFEVVCEDSAVPRRGVPGLSAPIVGRDPELDLLRTLLARVTTERRPHLVTIYGEPGVGKSRLAQEFLAVAEDGRRVVRGRCLPYGDGVTYWPLAEILKGVADVRDSDSPEVALGRIRALRSDLLGDDQVAVRAGASLAFTTGLDDPEVSFADLDPKAVREEMGLAWVAFFRALAARQDVLAVIEDIHWADPALLDLLEELAERLDGPVLFLCPARPELLAHRPTWGGGKRNYSALALDPLTEAQAETLIEALLDIDDLPAAVHRQILERAGGNPFFLEEIVRQLADAGFVAREGERWRASGEVDRVVIPDTVQAVLAARIDLLAPESRRALQAAAVVGRVFWPGAITRLTGANGEMAAALTPLVDRDMVRLRPTSTFAGESEYVFKHVLTRDVAYETLPRRERAAAHAEVAGWIEETVGERAGEYVDLLAHHHVEAYRAGRESAVSGIDLEAARRRAYSLTLQAAEAARLRLALDRAVRFCRRALDLADGPRERSHAAEVLGDTHFDGYEGDDSWAAYVLAIEEALRDPEPESLRLARIVGMAVSVPMRWPGSMTQQPTEEEVARTIELGMAHLPPGDTPERVQLLATRASWPFAFPAHDYTDAQNEEFLAIGLEAADAALRLDRADLASAAIDAAAGSLLNDSRYAEATRVEQRRLDLLDRISDPLERGDAYGMMAWASTGTGHWTAAEGYAEEGLEDAREASPNTTVHLLAWLTEARYRLGNWDGALEAFDELLGRLGDRRNDPPNFTAHGFAAAARLHLARGERAEALEIDDMMTRRVSRTVAGVRPFATQIPLMVALGRLDDARARLDDRLPGWRVSSSWVFEGEAAWLEATGSWDAAASAASEMRAFGEPRGCRPIVWRGDLLDARRLVAIGDGDGALVPYERARAGFDDGGMAYDVATCDLEVAETLGIATLDPRGRERLEEASALFERLRAVDELDRVRRLG